MFEQIDLFFASVQEEEQPKKKITEQDLQEKHDKKYEQRLLTPQEWELYRLITVQLPAVQIAAQRVAFCL